MAGMTDEELIRHYGGPAAMAQLLQFGKYGTQRVHNWLRRGIPAAVKVQYPHIFLRRRSTSRSQRG